MISAKVIADSVSPRRHRLTTLEVTLPRIVLAELNTHRVFSRNSASSRAIPVSKTMKRVAQDPFVPAAWPTEQKGMSGGEGLSPDDASVAENLWLDARDAALERAEALALLGVHKSLVNRLLEPFMWHTVIITSTEWDGFWHQRCSPLAMPEMRLTAEAMRDAYNASTPKPVGYNEWHLPYIQDDEGLELAIARGVSAARCARVSYLTHDGVRDIDADLALYNRLITADPPHASPLEHVATPGAHYQVPLGNFVGWFQLRHSPLAEVQLHPNRSQEAP